MSVCREGAVLHGLCSGWGKACLVTSSPGQVANVPPRGTWQMKGDLMGLQNAQALCHSYDTKEP